MLVTLSGQNRDGVLLQINVPRQGRRGFHITGRKTCCDGLLSVILRKIVNLIAGGSCTSGSRKSKSPGHNLILTLNSTAQVYWSRFGDFYLHSAQPVCHD